MPIIKQQPKKHDPTVFKWATVIDHDGFRCAIVAPTKGDLEIAFTRIAPVGESINWKFVQKVTITQRHDNEAQD